MQKSPSFLRNASPQGIRARSPSWINLTAYGEPPCSTLPALTHAPASTDAGFRSCYIRNVYCQRRWNEGQ